jgi:Protein of unknown function (DUF3224)
MMSIAMEAVTATGTFEVKPADEHAYHDVTGEARLTHAGGTQQFSGDIAGVGTIEWLMCYLPDKTARFVGLQRIEGSVDGRRGTFIMEAVGLHHGTGSEARWRIIEGSGTGELEGVTGQGGFATSGGSTASYHLDYRLP